MSTAQADEVRARTVLVVEDDENKLRDVVAFLAALLDADVEVRVARSFRGAVIALTEQPPDCVVLDMTIPNYDVSPTESGGRLRFFGGEDVMRKMTRAGIVVPTVVLTQFDEFGEGGDRVSISQLDERLRIGYDASYRGYVRYSATDGAWRDELRRVLRTSGVNIFPSKADVDG